MTNRRQFLQQSALISLAPWIPSFLPQTLHAADAKQDDRVLVVIQLDGGNDGLNTVIPFADDNYAKARPELKIADKSVLKLNETIGLHPAMKDAANLFQDGRLSIVQGVGYPNPNRSHFESMSIWQHARLDSRQHDRIGWLGQAFDSIAKRNGRGPDAVYVGGDSIPVALRGRRANAMSLERESDLALLTPVESSASSASGDDLLAFVTRTQDQSFQAVRQLEQSKLQVETTAYPSTELARRLQLISRLMMLGGGTRVFYAVQGGYDTHAAQADPHRALLREFSGALGAFLNDLKGSQLSDRVVVMAFSEFGRRVQENGSAGTDHGVAGPVFVAGNSLRTGLVGEHPSLVDLDEGDLKTAVDFRSVYATLLTKWLGIDATPVLGDGIGLVDLFNV